MYYKSKVQMPKELKKKCHFVIHEAMVAAAMGGGIPIPMSGAIPISGAQVMMIIRLGKVFDITLSNAAAKTVAGVTVAQQTGRAVFTNILKVIPGGKIPGAIIGATTAALLTEALGWIVADDFYRMSKGEEPENIVETADELKDIFKDLKFQKRSKS